MPDLPMLLGTARQRLDDRADRLVLALRHVFSARRSALDGAVRAIPSLPAMLEMSVHRLETGFRRLLFAMPNLLGTRRSDMEQLGRLPSPAQAIAAKRASLRLTAAHLSGSLRHAVSDARGRAGERLARLSEATVRSVLRDASSRLSSAAPGSNRLSPEAVLSRGYALIYDAKDRPVTSTALLRPGASIRLHLADGDARATVDGRSRRARACCRSDGGQALDGSREQGIERRLVLPLGVIRRTAIPLRSLTGSHHILCRRYGDGVHPPRLVQQALEIAVSIGMVIGNACCRTLIAPSSRDSREELLGTPMPAKRQNPLAGQGARLGIRDEARAEHRQVARQCG